MNMSNLKNWKQKQDEKIKKQKEKEEIDRKNYIEKYRKNLIRC